MVREGSGEEFGVCVRGRRAREREREREREPTTATKTSFLFLFLSFSLSSRRRALQVRDQVRAILGFLEAGEDHLGPWISILIF